MEGEKWGSCCFPKHETKVSIKNITPSMGSSELFGHQKLFVARRLGRRAVSVKRARPHLGRGRSNWRLAKVARGAWPASRSTRQRAFRQSSCWVYHAARCGGSKEQRCDPTHGRAALFYRQRGSAAALHASTASIASLLSMRTTTRNPSHRWQHA